MYSVEDLRNHYFISDAWRDEGYEGSPAKCCRSPFRDDRNASFSVFASDTQFKDHATGESGDVFTFLQISRNCDFREALRIVHERVGGHVSHSRTKPLRTRNRAMDSSPIHTKPAQRFCEMPTELRELWADGKSYLASSASECAKIDEWRNWPSDTTRTLCEDGLIALPKVRGKREVAFAVFAHVSGGREQIGMHARIESEKAFWQFLPNKKSHGVGLPPLPFILGHGHLATAKLVIIAEGQWDCISWAAWMGWLDHDSAWPSGIALMGILGANNWKTAPRHAHWPTDAAIALVPDNDPAGNRWKGNFLQELKKRSRKVSVFQPTENDLSDQLAVAQDKQGLLAELMERATA